MRNYGTSKFSREFYDYKPSNDCYSLSCFCVLPARANIMPVLCQEYVITILSNFVFSRFFRFFTL